MPVYVIHFLEKADVRHQGHLIGVRLIALTFEKMIAR